MKNRSLYFTLAVLLGCSAAMACTTAIISGKGTPDGRPLLFKHRDASSMDNVMRYFQDGKYPYIGLCNAEDTLGTEVWGGCNSAGFAIMNSASYNLNSDTSGFKDQEGMVMKAALQTCATVQEFQSMLESWSHPLPVEANFGVIDAAGGAAYFETGNSGFVRIDADDPKVAPFGYLVRTNYSFTGEMNKGAGYIRFASAEELFYRAASVKDLTVRFLLEDVSRCLKHGLTQVDLTHLLPMGDKPCFVAFEDFIVRNSSSATVLVHGARPDENPDRTTLWTILGFQLSSVAMPLWVAGGESLPGILSPGPDGKAPLCRAALKLKDRCFPVTRGSGTKYLDLAAAMNQEGTGIRQKLVPLEKKILKETALIQAEWKEEISQKNVQKFYRKIEEMVIEGYLQFFGSDLKVADRKDHP